MSSLAAIATPGLLWTPGVQATPTERKAVLRENESRRLVRNELQSSKFHAAVMSRGGIPPSSGGVTPPSVGGGGSTIASTGTGGGTPASDGASRATVSPLGGT